MRICSRCNKEVSKGQIYCPRCGFSLMKNIYGERVDFGGKVANPPKIKTEKKNNTFRKSNNSFNTTRSFKNMSNTNVGNKKNARPIVFLIMFIYFIIIFGSIIASIFEEYDNTKNETDKYEDNSSGEVIDFNEIPTDYSLITTLLDDNLKVRELFKSDNISKETIASNTSLEIDDLNNTWCNFDTYYKSESRAILCITTAHTNNSDYDNAVTFKNNYSNIVYEINDEDLYDLYHNIYSILDDMYYLSRNTYDTYDVFKTKYDALYKDLKEAKEEISNY